MRLILVVLISLAFSAKAAAAELAIKIATEDGVPVKDAVITVDSAAAAKDAPIKFPWPYVMAQQDVAFHPFVLIVPVGTRVAFPNHDKVRHHVYSFSKGNKFELKLYGRDESRSVTFDHEGIVALGCNIHDQMTAFIDVISTPFAGKTGTDGTVRLVGLPAGQAILTVWHPYLRSSHGHNDPITRQVTVPVEGTLDESFTLDVRYPPPPDPDEK